MVGEEVDRGEERFAARRAAVDIIDHPVDHEARRIIIAGQRRGLAVLGPAGGFIHALDRPLKIEEHTSELQSLMRNSYAVFCLKKKRIIQDSNTLQTTHNVYNNRRQ